MTDSPTPEAKRDPRGHLQLCSAYGLVEAGRPAHGELCDCGRCEEPCCGCDVYELKATIAQKDAESKEHEDAMRRARGILDVATDDDVLNFIRQDHDHIETIERLKAENAELRNGLLKFGRHTYACTANWCTECQHHVSDIRAEVTGCKMSRHYPRPCNCGLAALQSAQKEK